MGSKKSRWFRITLCSMLFGAVLRLYECYVWMSMGEIAVNAPNAVLEERYWDIFPSQCLRFWPLFLRESKDAAAFLEKTNPVLVETRVTGFGSFVTDIKLLSPAIVAEWQGTVWCISKEGRMWNVADGSLGFSELEIPLKPLWRIPALAASGDVSPGFSAPAAVPGGVFPSVVSTDAIEDFLSGLGGASWFGGVEEVFLTSRAGAVLFELRYAREGQNFTILVQKGKYEWEELSLAIGQVLDRFAAEAGQAGGSRLIDATYVDKIVVRDLSGGAVEGSSR